MPTLSSPLDQKTLIGYLWAARRRFRGGLALVLLRSLAAAPTTLLIQKIVDKPLQEKNIQGVIHYSIYFVIFLLFHYGFSVWGARSLAKTTTELMVDCTAQISTASKSPRRPAGKNSRTSTTKPPSAR